MSYLLETLGRGLLSDLRTAFDSQLPDPQRDDLQTLRARFGESPTSFDLAMRVGAASLHEMRLSEARAAFESARHIDPVSGKPLLGLACVCDELGQLDRALRYLNAAQARDASDPAIAFGIAFCHERLGYTTEAKASYRRAIELCPQLRNAYERLAAIAVRDGDWAAALEQYEQLVEMEPGDLDALLTLGNLYLLAQRPLDAIDQYQNALLIEPENSMEPAETAEALARDGSLSEAIHSMQRLVEKYPEIAPFHVQLADLYVKAGDDSRALAEYNTALATQPNFLEATIKLGTQHMRQGRYADASLSFNHAAELNDRLITAFAGLGVAQHDCGRERESLATFDLAVSLEPSSTLLFSEATRLQFESRQARPDDARDPGDDAPSERADYDLVIHEALRRHQQALATSPNHADLHYRYGLLLRQVGRYNEAVQALRNAVAINPTYSKALIKLAICLKECGETDEAIETFQRALAVDRRYVDVHYQLGLLFAQRNQFDLAAEEFEQALAGSANNPSFRANLALALQNIGMVDKAAATWRSVYDLCSDVDGQLSQREQLLRDVNQH